MDILLDNKYYQEKFIDQYKERVEAISDKESKAFNHCKKTLAQLEQSLVNINSNPYEHNSSNHYRNSNHSNYALV